jgi:hypothetical protein
VAAAVGRRFLPLDGLLFRQLFYRFLIHTRVGINAMPEMPEGIISMHDMAVIYEVTDPFGIDREAITVELSKEDPGSIGRNARGIIEITVPESGTVAEFAQRLRAELEAMGYIPRETEDQDQDDA